jgi:uncharacterized protein
MIAERLRCAFGVLVLIASFIASAADVPYLTGRVVDNAEILSPAARAKLAADLKAHEDLTTNQIAVLTVRSLEGDSVEDFAVRVFEAWKLGQKGKDNGVLVVVAPTDRRMRIEVGYGLEGTLTDAAAARIIRDRMTPRFKANDYDGGVAQGVAAIVGTLEGSAAAPADTSGGGEKKQGFLSFLDSADVSEFEKDLPPWPMRILLGAFIFGIIGLFTFLGIMTPGMGWFLYLFLIPFWAMFPIIVVGVKGALLCLVTYVIGFPLAKLLLRGTDWYAKAVKEMKTTGRTNMGGMVITSGGSSSSGSSGGGSSGGGFSGGGGSSGGGGASGSW